jgi:hypothetical protein
VAGWPGAVALVAGVSVTTLALASCGGGGDDGQTTVGGRQVGYAQVQAVFEEYGCIGCHPGVNPSLDLRAGRSYDQLVGVQALEDPTLYRVVAGDPGRSFLYLKVGGDPPVADIPAIGTRMPPRAPPIAAKDLETIRLWIGQGAKDVDGKTKGPRVATPGTPPTGLDVADATKERGTGRITGSVVDQRRRPIRGALVTLLLKGAGQEGGEEHYRAAITGAGGRFTLPDMPQGSFLLKAYGPNTIYVSRIVALDPGERQEIRFGLPSRRIVNPRISSPRVERTESGMRLSMVVRGDDLDGNYTLAVNRRAGVVAELHNRDNAPGRWSAAIDRRIGGSWTFLAVDENCNVSEFLELRR